MREYETLRKVLVSIRLFRTDFWLAAVVVFLKVPITSSNHRFKYVSQKL